MSVLVYLDARMIEMSGIGTYIKMIAINNDLYDGYLGDVNTLKKYFDESTCISYDAKIYSIKEQFKFPYSKINKGSILHCPHYNIPLFYFGRMITTIHDITHILFPEYLPNKLAYWYAKFMIKMACVKSEKIITVSENTKNDLVKYFNVKPEKIVVTYNAIDPIYCKLNPEEYESAYAKYGIDKNKKILLYVGNKKPHKNLERLLYAFNKCKIRDEAVMIFVGKDFGNYTRLDEIIEELSLQDKVIHTGAISNEELVKVYNLADLFVFPSLYEGFGIPPLEAMACGTPVIASTTPAVVEVLGDSAVYFDPYDIDEMSLLIDNMLLENKLLLSYKSKLKIEEYTLDELIRKTRKVFCDRIK